VPAPGDGVEDGLHQVGALRDMGTAAGYGALNQPRGP
jgi:hypothetical protein